METVPFKTFSLAVNAKFNEMAKGELFVVDVAKEDIWDTYMNAFPEGTNNIYKERREYDCNCCKSFIRRIGTVVSVVDGKLVSVWDVDVGGYYSVVAKAMSEFVKSAQISTKFLHDESKVSVANNNNMLLDDGTVKTWNHFYCEVPKKFIDVNKITTLSNINSTKQVFERGLKEITTESLEIILDLILQDSLYRGAEFKAGIESFLTLKKKYESLTTEQEKSIFVWSNVASEGARIRNTAIGTLMVDLSENVELNKAVSSFESKVAPSNYKRTSAPISKGMIDNAMKIINELGLESALQRRYARFNDVRVNNVLFVDNHVASSMKGSSLESLLMGAVKTPQISQKSLDNMEEIKIDDFISNVLPKATSLEVMVKNAHTGNFMSLYAPVDSECANILKWDNNFSWGYNGEVADSMREAVVNAGGRVDGAFRFTHAWNHSGNNQSLMDLHVFFPTSDRQHKDVETNDLYGNEERVGWNNRQHRSTGGIQDVDFTAPACKKIPIENITFPDVKRMPEGVYTLKIHNWDRRLNQGFGFRAEIECGGNIYQYEYDKEMKHKEWVTVARVTLKNGMFSVEHVLPCGSVTSKNVWGVDTEKFVKVSSVMLSPNYWDEQKETGNKHYFFILDGCNNPEESRGLYNEFLANNLTPHRKVFDLLANKMKATPTTDQLSGVGFSSTVRNELIVKVSGSFTRMLKIKF